MVEYPLSSEPVRSGVASKGIDTRPVIVLVAEGLRGGWRCEE